MRREGKKSGVRTNHSIRYFPICSTSCHPYPYPCEIHSIDILNFVYQEMKRLNRPCNLTRLELIKLSKETVEHVKSRDCNKAFRCMKGPERYKKRYEMRNYRYRSRNELVEEMKEQLAIVEFN